MHVEFDLEPGTLLIVGLALAYLTCAFVAALVMRRLDDDGRAVVALFWPLLLAFGVIYLPVYLIGYLSRSGRDE
jgi:ABC-type Mn2+/Zn2+ transport system permease subunit